MQDSERSEKFDHTSDPNFYAYYVDKSALPSARDHFIRIRDKTISVLTAQRPGNQKFRMLDVGCGAGTQARLWAELGHDVFGLDVNAPLLEVGRARARKDGLRIQFDLGSATSLPYEDESMDACLMLELLEHVQEWQACIREAVRVIKPGGVIYLSTTNSLCPKQQEFNLPMYSWYPGFLKRRFERLAVTTRPELANYARYPAVNWFTFYALRRFLSGLGVRCLDRFDLIDEANKGLAARGMLWAVKNIPPLRLAAHMMTPGTTLLGIKRNARVA